MSPTVWTKLEAIKTMTEKMMIPNHGWSEIYLLLSVLPAGWVPGNPIVSASLMEMVASRGRFGIDEWQCRRIAQWLGCCEAMALWKVLYMELAYPQGLPAWKDNNVGEGSVWLGGSACMSFPDVKARSGVRPAPILQLLGPQGFQVGFRIDVDEGIQIDRTFKVRRTWRETIEEPRDG